MKLKPITANTTYTLKLVYADSDKVPIDITGATATLVMRKNMHSDALITKSANIVGNTGSIIFVIPAEETTTLLDERNQETFLIGSVLTLASGEVIDLFQTSIVVNENIVR